jgi:hypothetical protein
VGVASRRKRKMTSSDLTLNLISINRTAYILIIFSFLIRITSTTLSKVAHHHLKTQPSAGTMTSP